MDGQMGRLHVYFYFLFNGNDTSVVLFSFNTFLLLRVTELCQCIVSHT